MSPCLQNKATQKATFTAIRRRIKELCKTGDGPMKLTWDHMRSILVDAGASVLADIVEGAHPQVGFCWG